MKKTNTLLLIVLMVLTSISVKDNSINRKIASQSSTIADINYRRIFISNDHSWGYRGLFHFEDDYEYTRRLFGQIIQTAHTIASDDWYRPTDNIYKHYYLFLLLSILVPHHESSLMHFTLRDKERYCYYSNDVIDPVHPKDFAKTYYQGLIEQLEMNGEKNESSEKKRKEYQKQIKLASMLEMGMNHFNRSMGENKLAIKHCSKLKTQMVYQLMFSGDYADIGMFMLNARSHGGFFATRGILNFDKVMNYALNYLYKGFKEISLNAEKYPCLKDLSEKDFYKYSKNILKGSWAGKYNSGNTGSTCRFTDLEHKFAANDLAYNRTMNKFLNPEDLHKNIFFKFLPEESLERKAFLELLSNVKEAKNNSIYIAEVLKTDYHSESSMILTDNNDRGLPLAQVEQADKGKQIESTLSVSDLPAAPYVDFDFKTKEEDHLIKAYIVSKDANIRQTPEILPTNICGNTKNSQISPQKLEVLRVENDWVVVSPEFLSGIITNECEQAEELFVFNSLVKMKKDYTDLKQIQLKTTVTLRDDIGSEGQIVGNLGPSRVYLVQTKYEKDQTQWVQIIDPHGNKVWFLAGNKDVLNYEIL